MHKTTLSRPNAGKHFREAFDKPPMVILDRAVSRCRPTLRFCSSHVARGVFIFLAALVLTACEGLGYANRAKPEPAPAPIMVLPSAAPLENATEVDVRFAQAALKELGYRIGYVDGIWGPRSAAAIQEFEQANNLVTAEGRLSELNLMMLEQASNLSRNGFSIPEPSKPIGLAAKIDQSIPATEVPQLVIIDEPYTLLAKPNPFSKILTTLQTGTGIYVIRLQEGWYEVESEDRIRGYIKDE
ncbi:MAG: peptidoglycan-binding protein [Gammaproteobacteria bacterium]|nr:peptidoglycan-binding protein [Gammaproteobacteria bacterium]